jgi:hypothetical protein
MKAGEQAARQFDDALVSAMGVEAKHAKREDTCPFTVAADLQKMYWSQTRVCAIITGCLYAQRSCRRGHRHNKCPTILRGGNLSFVPIEPCQSKQEARYHRYARARIDGTRVLQDAGRAF